MPSSSRDALIEAYLASLPRLRRAVADLSPEQLQARPVPGKWSTLEVVCHLVDSEQAWCHRMKRVIAEERPLLIGYDETRFTAALPYHEATWRRSWPCWKACGGRWPGSSAVCPRPPGRAPACTASAGLMTLEEMLRPRPSTSRITSRTSSRSARPWACPRRPESGKESHRRFRIPDGARPVITGLRPIRNPGFVIRNPSFTA